MAVADKPKHTWIPPPPLPEFYVARTSGKKSASTSSSDTYVTEEVDEKQKSVNVTFEARRKHTDVVDEPSVSSNDGAYDGRPTPPGAFASIPPPQPPAVAWGNAPSLAVYHICRLCLRPRSARYHRQHPIPINGVPPPPGICRRCRVTSVNDTSEVVEIDEIVKEGRSNDIKIGLIRPFVPKEAVISNREAKRMQVDRYLRGRSRDRNVTIYREVSREDSRKRCRSRSRRRDIVYRHVQVVDEPEPRRRPEVLSTAEAVRRKSYSASRSEVYRSAKTSKGTSMQAQPTEIPPTMLSDRETAKTSSSSSARTLPQPVERTDFEIRRMIGEEIQRQGDTTPKPERPESDIRRIAREEVSRYRQAERKLESHSQAFAHGKLVPTQRSIEIKTGPSQNIPWEAQRAAPLPPRSVAEEKVEPSRSSYFAGFEKKEEGVRSERQSWGPQWRREFSLERRRSSERRSETWKPHATGAAAKTASSTTPKNLAVNDKPLATYDVARDSEASRPTWKDQGLGSGGVYKTGSVPRPAINHDERVNMGAGASQRYDSKVDYDRKREVVERLEVFRGPSSSAKPGSQTPRFGRPLDTEAPNVDSYRQHPTDRTARPSPPPQGSGVMPIRSTRAHGRQESPAGEPWERGSQEHTEYLAEKERLGLTRGYQAESGKRLSSRNEASNEQAAKASGVEYEYKLRTVRPANGPDESGPRETPRSRRSSNSDPVVLQVWQQVPTDPLQRAKDAPRQQKDMERVIEEYRREYEPEPTSRPSQRRGSQVNQQPSFGAAADAQRPRENSVRRERRPSPASPRREGNRGGTRQRSPLRASDAPSPQRRNGGVPNRGSRPDEVTYEVWQQVPISPERARRGDHGADTNTASRATRERSPPEAVTYEVWQQVPIAPETSAKPRSSAAPEPAPVRRRRERREHHRRHSEQSDHVKFSSKIDISPTPPGSDDSSGAFRRFHDFNGRRGSLRQIDGHDSEERGEDLITEYERRGRLRSREPRSRRSEYTYEDRDDVQDRDQTVKPRGGPRKYDGKRDDGWRPLLRALSESPSRENLGVRRASEKGPPFHPDERPSASMTTRDGSYTGRRRR